MKLCYFERLLHQISAKTLTKCVRFRPQGALGLLCFADPRSAFTTYKAGADSSEEQCGLFDDHEGAVDGQDEGGVHVCVGADGPRGDLKQKERH